MHLAEVSSVHCSWQGCALPLGQIYLIGFGQWSVVQFAWFRDICSAVNCVASRGQFESQVWHLKALPEVILSLKVQTKEQIANLIAG